MFKFIDLKKLTATTLLAVLMTGTLISSPGISVSSSNNGHGNNCDGVDSSNPGKAPHIDTDPSVDDEGKGNCSTIDATGELTPDMFAEIMGAQKTISLERTITVNIDDVLEEITTTSAPEKLDILFIADNTGSMGEEIADVQTNAQNLLTTLSDTYSDIQFGVARYYGDPTEYGSTGETITESVPTGETTTYTSTYTYLGRAWRNGRRKYKYLKTTTGGGETSTRYKYYNRSKGSSFSESWEEPVYETVSLPKETKSYELQEPVNGGTVQDSLDAIDDWWASGGGDLPEGNFFALHQAATSGTSTNSGYATGYDTNWRDDAKKLIVWFGDAKSHTSAIDQTEAIQALNNNDVTVVAVYSSSSFSNTWGLNANNQASTVASETGGQYAAAYSDEVASTMLDLIGTAAVETTTTTIHPTIDLVFESEGDTEGLDITYVCTDPLGCEDVNNGDSRKFRMDITGNVAGIYDFKTVVANVSGAEADNDITVYNID